MVPEKDILFSVSGFGSTTNFNLLGMLTLVAEHFWYICSLGSKSRRMRWAGHVARMGEERGCIGSCWGNQREGDHWGDLGVDGWIILGWISRRYDVGIWTGLGWPRIETGGEGL